MHIGLTCQNSRFNNDAIGNEARFSMNGTVTKLLMFECMRYKVMH